MKYEEIENNINKINEQIININNLIVELTWIDNNFTKNKIKNLEQKVNTLIDKKYELLDLIA